MKRWILWGVATVLLLTTTIVSLAWWRPVYLITATAMISPDLAAKWAVNLAVDQKKKTADRMQEQSEKNLELQVIRIELEGRRYDVPIRYTYGQAFEKRGYWPSVKPGRIQVSYLWLSVLLPDLKPYYPEDDAIWKALGRGDKLEVTIEVNKIDWFQRLRDRYFNEQDQFQTRQGEIHGLVLFASQGQLDDIYFPVDAAIELIMYCNKEPKREGFTPGCRVQSNYRSGSDLSYSFSRDYFPDWREIDSKLKALFDQFEQVAQSASNHNHEEK